MTEKRTGSFRNKSSGSYQKSSNYHPYRSGGQSSSNGRYNGSSSTSRVVTVKEALKSERVLSIESFSNVEHIKDAEVSSEYALYVKKHVKTFLKNIYNRHKKEKWITQIINGQSKDILNVESFKWTGKKNSLQYSEEFDMQLDDQSNDTNFSSGTEVRLSHIDSNNFPEALTGILPSFYKQLITMSNIPPYVDCEALERHLHEYAPDSTIEITAPNSDKSFYRLAWLKFNEVNGIAAELNDLIPKLESLGSIEGAKVYFGILSSNFRRFKVTNYLADFEEELSSLALKVIKSFEPEFDESILLRNEEEECGKAEMLDKAVFYLRKVHNYCFYCVNKFSCPQEMLLKCGDLHLRTGKPDDGSNYDHNRLIEKISAFIDFKKVLLELSIEGNSESVEDVLCESSISKVEEGKYRCVHCSKAFKGPEFVLKHLSLKHEDVLQQAQVEIEEYSSLLRNAPIWIFPSTMIPRYTKIRGRTSSGSQSNSRTSDSRKSSFSSTTSSARNYNDWDSVKNSSTEIDYDL